MNDYFSPLSAGPIALGANTFGWTADQPSSFAVLDAFVERGGAMIDTADCYPQWADASLAGSSETIIGQWLRKSGKRDQVIIATKVGSMKANSMNNLRPDNIRKACADSRERLGVDVIDLYYAHRDDPETPLRETIHTFADLQEQGLIRHVGISNYSPQRINEWLTICQEDSLTPPVALQPHYNLVFRHDYEDERAQIAADNNLDVFPYFSLAAGFLTGKYRCVEDIHGDRAGMVEPYVNDTAFFVVHKLNEIAAGYGLRSTAVALAWLMAQPTITAPLVSARNIQQLEQIWTATTLRLSNSELEALSRISKRL